jgi:hypothetical protein
MKKIILFLVIFVLHGGIITAGSNVYTSTSVGALTCPDGSFVPDSEADACPPPSTGGGSGDRIVVNQEECDFTDVDILGIPVWYKYLDGQKDVTIFEGNTTEGDCRPVLARDGDGFVDASSGLAIGLAVLEIMMTLGGLVAVGMVIWGSFSFVLSQGEPDKAAGARKTVINAAIGLVIIIVATRVVSFIATTLSGPTP